MLVMKYPYHKIVVIDRTLPLIASFDGYLQGLIRPTSTHPSTSLEERLRIPGVG